MLANNPLAPRWRRLVCLFYEALLLTALLIGAVAPMAAIMWGYAQAAHALPSGPLWSTFDLVYMLGVTYVYFAYCWRRSGQTLAMKTWRLRLVAGADGMGWSVMTLRYGVVLATTAPLVVAVLVLKHIPASLVWTALGIALLPYAWAFVDRDQQFLHDRLAETHVEIVPPSRHDAP